MLKILKIFENIYLLCVLRSFFFCSYVTRSGKCIGEKNLKAFYTFTALLCFQVYYLIGVFVYYVVYLVVGAPVGPGF